MIISYSKKFIVHHLEKTGGTTVEKSIKPYLVDGDLYLRDWQYYMFDQRNGLNEHAGAGASQAFLGESWGKFRKFATVREPVQIMQSLYSYARWIYENTPRNEVVPRGAPSAYSWAVAHDMGPDGFVSIMFADNYQMVFPQTVRLDPMLTDGMIVDLSQLNDRWYEITQYLGFTYRIPMVMANVLGSSNVMFSDKTVDNIKRWFEADYDILPSITGVKW